MRRANWYLGLLTGCGLLAGFSLRAQDDPKQRVKAVHDLGQGGSETIPRIVPYLSDPEVAVRREAVKAIVDIGTQRSLDPLIQATADNDPEIQIRASDGLVNFYLPGYVKTGLTATPRRVGTFLKGKFTDTNDQVVDAYIQARPEVVLALGRIVRGGANLEARFNAARAVGILRGREAIPDLEEALRSKETALIYESLVALQKIRDPGTGPAFVFLLHDLDRKVQITAIETTGLLANRGALNDLRDVLDRSHYTDVKRAALTALAQMPDPQLHGIFTAYLDNKDEGLREGAAEGIARLKNPADRPAMESAFAAEKKTGPRLALAFALVALGKRDMGEFDPLRYLVDNLNSSAFRGTARPYLTELARDPEIRHALYPALQQPTTTKDEKTGLAWVLGQSGAEDSVAPLQSLTQDSDAEVSQEALRALKTLHTRVP
jgi:HEAT repeat protein